MNESALTPDQILEAAEDVLRRFGPAKATVVDVARVLGVSHGSVYRHFISKAALRDAVVERWLERILAPLTKVAAAQGAAPQRLRRWFELLISSKRKRALEDPELFMTYFALASDARDVVKAHVDTLLAQVTHIIADGVERNEFTVADPAIAARAVFDATVRFHKPAHVSDWANPDIDKAFANVWSLIARGMGVHEASSAPPRTKRSASTKPRKHNLARS